MIRMTQEQADALQTSPDVAVLRMFVCTSSHVCWVDGLYEVLSPPDDGVVIWTRKTTRGLAFGPLDERHIVYAPGER